MADPDLSKLRDLHPAARARVESAFKKAIETELAAGAAVPQGDLAATHSRSRGAIFSRSRTGDAMRDPGAEAVAKDLHTMDDATFNRFAERLSTLKKIAKPGG